MLATDPRFIGQWSFVKTSCVKPVNIWISLHSYFSTTKEKETAEMHKWPLSSFTWENETSPSDCYNKCVDTIILQFFSSLSFLIKWHRAALHSVPPSRESKREIKNLLTNKNLGPHGFIGEFYQTNKEEMIPILHKLLSENRS